MQHAVVRAQLVHWLRCGRAAGYESNKALQRCFQTYCWHSVGKGRLYGEPPRLNSAQFYQLCRDAGFLEPRGAAGAARAHQLSLICSPTTSLEHLHTNQLPLLCSPVNWPICKVMEACSTHAKVAGGLPMLPEPACEQQHRSCTWYDIKHIVPLLPVLPNFVTPVAHVANNTECSIRAQVAHMSLHGGH
jgi:hypothetical protein